MADSKLLYPSVSSSKSPPPNCAICLGSCSNKCYSDTCMHEFCFKCLLQWSKIKAECPLCKQPFKSIIHNVKSNQEYEEHIVERPRYTSFDDLQEDYFTLPNVSQSLRQHRFHFRTTFTVNTHGENAIQQMLLSPSLSNGIAIYSYVPSGWTYQGRRRRGDTSTSFRRSIYANNLWAHAPADVTGRFREVTPQVFANYPMARTRLAPWLNRELNALLHENTQDVMQLFDTIMENLLRHHICSRTFRNILHHYLDQKTDHFVHEFYNFMKSPYDMIGYDRYVTYLEQPSSPTPMIDISDESNDSDVIIVGQSSNSNPVLIELLSDTDDDDIIITSCPSYMMKKDKTENQSDRMGASGSSTVTPKHSSSKRRRRTERSSVSSISSSSESSADIEAKRKEERLKRKKKKQSYKHKEKKKKSSSKSYYSVDLADSDMEDMPLSQYMKYLNKKDKEKRRKRKHKSTKHSKSRSRKRDMRVQSEKGLAESNRSTNHTITVDLSRTPPLPFDHQRSSSGSLDWQILPPSPINITVTTSIHDENSNSDATIQIESNRNSLAQYSLPDQSSGHQNDTQINVQHSMNSSELNSSSCKLLPQDHSKRHHNSLYGFYNSQKSEVNLNNSIYNLDNISEDIAGPSTSSYNFQSRNYTQNNPTSSSEDNGFIASIRKSISRSKENYLETKPDFDLKDSLHSYRNTYYSSPDARISNTSVPEMDSYKTCFKNICKPDSSDVIDLSLAMKTEHPINDSNVMLNSPCDYSHNSSDCYRGCYNTKVQSNCYPSYFTVSPSVSNANKPCEYWTDFARNENISSSKEDGRHFNDYKLGNYYHSFNGLQSQSSCNVKDLRSMATYSDSSDSD